MKKDSKDKKIENLRQEDRKENQNKASVEFIPAQDLPAYHFKLKDFSSKGFGILVRKDSKVLEFIKPGDILDMKYHPEKATANPESYRTEIKHISEPEPGTHKDHMLVGLMIVD